MSELYSKRAMDSGQATYETRSKERVLLQIEVVKTDDIAVSIRNGVKRLQIVVFLRKGNRLCLRQLLVVERHQLGIDGDLSRGQSGGGNKVKAGVSNELAPEPKERFLEVII